MSVVRHPPTHTQASEVDLAEQGPKLSRFRLPVKSSRWILAPIVPFSAAVAAELLNPVAREHPDTLTAPAENDLPNQWSAAPASRTAVLLCPRARIFTSPLSSSCPPRPRRAR